MQKAQAEQQLNQQKQVQEQLEQLETVAKRFMTPEAILRYGNVKAVYTERAIQSIIVIAQMVQQGQLKQAITDEQYKDMLRTLIPEKRETIITKK